MAAAALGGYVLCGINTTRRGEGLLSDIHRSDCQLLLVDGDHAPMLDGLDTSGVTVLDVSWCARRGLRPARSGRAGPG
jgi:fatty-acyl-CoA synthase